jgi:tol-pal system protein YbgF
MKPLMIAFFCCLVSVQNYALAPVVDDSENFAILDEQQADYDQPVVHQEYNDSSFDERTTPEERPLAHDEPHSRNQNQADLLNQIQGMQQDIQELRGQLEMQSHNLQQLKDQQLAFYKDIDTRLGQTQASQASQSPLPKTSTAPVTAELSLNQAQPQFKTPVVPAPTTPSTMMPTNNSVPATIPTPSSGHTNPADEQISYMAAYELVKNKQFDHAIDSMQAFITRYPHGGYTSNAQYWLGELYMVKKNYPEAIQHFDVVLNQYPNSSKSAASLLKIGYALAASGKGTEAKQKLNQVIKNYPDTATAQLAAAKLKTLNAS